MRLTLIKAAFIGLALVLVGAVAATAQTRFPKAKDVEKIMKLHSDDYLHPFF